MIVLNGDDPQSMRIMRVPGGWHAQGTAASHPELTAPEPWTEVGLCWAGREHPVVDATNYQPTRPQPDRTAPEQTPARNLI